VPVSETTLYHEYVLTEMGRQLFPVVTALRQWGSEYLFEPSEPRQCLVGRHNRSSGRAGAGAGADGEPRRFTAA
ncbi:MAG: hypothetical protein QOG14_2660, partial [Mycobacterium sp.]|nr:hypothetical protein [Mycobacterium sp.]